MAKKRFASVEDHISLTPNASNDLLSSARRLGASLGTTIDGFDFHAFEVS